MEAIRNGIRGPFPIDIDEKFRIDELAWFAEWHIRIFSKSKGSFLRYVQTISDKNPFQ